ncbi:Hypothetical predicted protein, partial [Paramuricea clavata]
FSPRCLESPTLAKCGRSLSVPNPRRLERRLLHILLPIGSNVASDRVLKETFLGKLHRDNLAIFHLGI